MSNVIILDVREPDEFAEGHVNGALNIPVDLLMHDVSVLKDVPKDDKILVYCRTGRRSGYAQIFLEENGFTDVINGINQKKMESKFLK